MGEAVVDDSDEEVMVPETDGASGLFWGLSDTSADSGGMCWTSEFASLTSGRLSEGGTPARIDGEAFALARGEIKGDEGADDGTDLTARAEEFDRLREGLYDCGRVRFKGGEDEAPLLLGRGLWRSTRRRALRRASFSA